jgi:hypothetical protein
MPRCHVAIISWADKGPAAVRIAAALAPLARVTVLYSNPAETPETGPGTWVHLPNSAYFGPKFTAALRATAEEEVLLLIHADTDYADWPSLLARCTAAFAILPDLGLWAPDFTFTPWRSDIATLFTQPEAPGLVSVMQTDGIITAFAPATLNRLRLLDLSNNNLGWGIDWAAVAFCYATGLRVLRDTTLIVTHTQSRGYAAKAAESDMAAFLAQLTMAERTQIALLRAYFLNREDAKRPWYSRLWHALAKQSRKDPISWF